MGLNKIKEDESLQSAVIVLHELSTDSLILTKRSEHLRHHPGEVCFPGGRWEKGDKDLYATAVRELNEELGIHSDRITLVKELPIENTLLGTIIHPWLAQINFIKPYQLNDQEVDSLISIPMSLVLKPKNYKEFIIERYGKQFKSCQFIPNEELIWGATARIMKRLKDVF